ncbi:2-octaprenyl-6-methoxyphenyl hydroxylase [Pelagibaculum spongiae]|uniref:2-octaprenyl-6-methoxyphenyl hydroxylase n=2 Tax=Pelagibaculum spongiae TaxID=2080658 RepID=A0A2V1H257_9GAMM|nr:2-octaprenyl-6-methoxyphenyl hydroxylase [Pelagibaculum spongiae]
MDQSIDFDILICGGGMAGASLALALAPQGWKIGIVEAVEPSSNLQPSYDDRSIALAQASANLFRNINLWPQLEPHCQPIRSIHVSDKGRFGVTRIQPQSIGLDALGYVIEVRPLGQVLHQKIAQTDNIHLICPAKLASLQQNKNSCQIAIETSDGVHQLSSKLLIAADGALSPVRRLLGLNHDQSDYDQSAIIANVTTEIAHAGRAFERFTDSGPLAMLPLTENRCSLVWCVKKHQLEQHMALDDQQFAEQLQQRFGWRLGRIEKAGQRSHYPLLQMRVPQQIKDRVMLIGNAAHAVHPVAGQGLNLGLRDVAELVESLSGLTSQQDPVLDGRLTEYQKWRNADQRKILLATHSLVTLFSNQSNLLGHLRGASLAGMDLWQPVKKMLARQATGLAGRLPSLIQERS